MPTIAVCSLYCEVESLRKVTEPNRIAYCERHGYAYHAEYASMDALRPPSWTKVLLLLRHLHKYEWVLWLDADAVIVRPEQKLEEIADPQADAVWRTDVNGINCGVMLLRNTDAVHDLLWDCYRLAEFRDHQWWEQAAIMHLLKLGPSRIRQKVVQHCEINSYPEEDMTQSFIVHAPGRSLAERIAVLGNAITMKILVLIPVKPNLHPALKHISRKLAEALPAANPAHRFTLVFDSRGTGDAHVRSLDDRVAHTAPIRQALIDQYLDGHDYVMWIDADVVDYPTELPTRLIERNPWGVSAPLVLLAGHRGRFYDVAGFVEEGRWANPYPPYFRQPGPVYDLDGVGCVYMVPGDVYRNGARYEAVPGYVDHMAICRHARSMGRPVRAYADLIAWHADLARYGEFRG